VGPQDPRHIERLGSAGAGCGAGSEVPAEPAVSPDSGLVGSVGLLEAGHVMAHEGVQEFIGRT